VRVFNRFVAHRRFELARRPLAEMERRPTLQTLTSERGIAAFWHAFIGESVAAARSMRPPLEAGEYAYRADLAALAIASNEPDAFARLCAAAEHAAADPTGLAVVELAHHLLVAAPGLGLLVARAALTTASRAEDPALLGGPACVRLRRVFCSRAPTIRGHDRHHERYATRTRASRTAPS
jgi:hypothetical protein